MEGDNVANGKSDTRGRLAFLKNYSFSLLLLGSIMVGCVLGLVLGKDAEALKPFGELLLNLLYMAVVPLVFFSISSAVAGVASARRVGRVLLYMMGIFVATGIVSSLLMLVGVLAWPMQYTLKPASAQGQAAQASTMPVSASQPATKPASQPATVSASQPATKPATQPATAPATQPATKPASQPATAPASQPATVSASQPATKPASQPATASASQPATKPASQPATAPATQPARSSWEKFLDTAHSLVKLLTAEDFVALLSRRNMMALIVFSLLLGLGASSAKEKGEPFVRFLQSGSEVMMRVVGYVMYYAPIGLAAYFAAFIGRYGPELIGGYGRAMAVYYPICLGYAGLGFTFYAWLAGGAQGVRRFWANIIPAMSTALATGSSVATIPTNLAAADRIGTPREISEIVIPIGATVHMDGSCMASLLKIAFLYALFDTPFVGVDTWAFAVVIAILAGMVTSGVPVGGFVGEAFLVSVYSAQFPDAVQALPLLQTIGVLVDPPATMVNAVGDNVAGMLVARILGGRGWMEKK